MVAIFQDSCQKEQIIFVQDIFFAEVFWKLLYIMHWQIYFCQGNANSKVWLMPHPLWIRVLSLAQLGWLSLAELTEPVALQRCATAAATHAEPSLSCPDIVHNQITFRWKDLLFWGSGTDLDSKAKPQSLPQLFCLWVTSLKCPQHFWAAVWWLFPQFQV